MISTNRLIHLFGQLTKKEQSDIQDKLVTMPNKRRKKLQDLFNFLVEQKKEDVLKELNPDILATHLFSEKVAYDDKELAHKKKKLSPFLITLIKLIEDKFIEQEIESKNFLREKLLLNAFSKRQLNVLWHDEFKKLERKVERVEREPKEKELEHQKHLFDSRMSYFDILKNENRDPPFDLVQVTDDLDAYLIISKLRHACMLLSLEKVSGRVFNHEFSNFLINYLEDTNPQLLERHPVIKFYYLAYKLMVEKKENYFIALQNLTVTKEQYFTKETFIDIYQFLINWKIGQHSNRMDHLRTLYSQYKEAYEKSVLHIHNKIQPSHYQNIITIGIKLKDYDWINCFIDIEKDKLDVSSEQQTAFYFYSKALLLFEKNKFQEAEGLLLQVAFKDPLNKLSKRVLLVKIYYETDNILLGNELDNFSKQLIEKRTKNTEHKKLYKSFVKFAKKLHKCNQHDRVAIKKLIENIEQFQSVLPEKEWLLEKAQTRHLKK